VSEPDASAGAMSIAMGVADVCKAATGLDANRSANTARMAGAQAAVIRRPIIKLTSSGKHERLQPRWCARQPGPAAHLRL
jgi:hypothetical protein